MIIIDEVSMVQSDLIDHIDFALRKWKKNQVAFGGVQLVLVGDCFQLSPWIKFGAEKKKFETKYKSQWFFDAYALQNIEFEPVNFTKIFRQKDLDFIRVLNRLRINRYSDNDIQYINDRCFNNKNIDQEQIILTTINEHADNLNKVELDKINSEIRKYNAKKVNMITDEITKTIPECLELKVGAKVVITKNINGAVNGSLAIVKEMYDDRVKIEVCDTKKIVVCTFEKWEQFEYEWDEINKKISSHKIGEYSQKRPGDSVSFDFFPVQRHKRHDRHSRSADFPNMAKFFLVFL